MSLVRIGGPPPLPSYLMDLALSEEFSFPGEATKFPVEKGAEFTDHIRELPDEITLECIVSDTPIGDVATDPTRQPVTGPDGTTSTALPSAEALQRMRELKALRQPVRIETTLGVFTSMAFIDLTVPVNKDKSPGRDKQPGALFFTAKFRKAALVTNKRTKVRVRSAMAGAGGQSKAKAVVGKVAVIDTTVIWQHGLATGTFIGVVSTVEIHYNRPSGMTRDEALALGGVAPESPLIDYFDQGSATPITGSRRAQLVADLRRAHELTFPPSNLGPNAFLRQSRNLPDGVNLDRFQQPAPSTFAQPTITSDDLSRFNRSVPPTFPSP